MKKVICLLIIIILASFSVLGVTYNSCEDDPNHFQDDFGNGYCSLEGLSININKYFTVENTVCSLNNGGL